MAFIIQPWHLVVLAVVGFCLFAAMSRMKSR